MLISFHDLQVKLVSTPLDSVLESSLARIQIDNNSEQEPIYPVLLQPKCLKGSTPHAHNLKPCPDPVLQFYVKTKNNVPNVKYLELVEFLVKELELKVELDHIFSILDWIMSVQQQLNTSLTTMSPVFRQKAIKVDSLREDESHFDQDLIENWRTQQILQKDDSILYIKQYKGSPLMIELSLFKQTVSQD